MPADDLFLVHQNITHCRTLWPTREIFFSKVYVIFNAALSGLGTLTNFLLLVGFYKSKLTNQITMKVACSLACSDFCISAFVVPTFLVALFLKDSNCKIHLILVYMFFTFAINTVCMFLVISIDRLLQISWPIQYRAHKTKKYIQTLIFTIWIVSPIAAICVFFTSPLTQIYVLLTIGMAFYTISAMSYARVLFEMHAHRKKIQTSSNFEMHSESSRKQIYSQNVKLESTRRNTKRITFKLHVEVIEDRSSRNEDLIINKRNMEQVLEIKDASHGTDARVESASGGSTNLSSFLSVPEEPKIKNEHMSYCGKVRRQDFQHDMADAIVEENENEKAGSAFGSQNDNTNKICTSLKTTLSRQGSRSRLEPVNFKGKDANTALSMSKEIKVTWTVALVITTLFVCYVPYLWSAYAWALEEYKNDKHSSKRLQSAYAWTLSVAFLHSTINPLIMLARSKALRFHVQELFQRLLP